MNSAYSQVAGTRPRIRRDVLFTATPDGVLFHNATSGFRVTAPGGYRLASLLVPHLDGSKSVADICAPLPERQRDLIASLVRALYERDLARDVPAADPQAPPVPDEVATRFAPQIDYLDHYGDRAPHRFAAFRQCAVAVLGTGPVATACATALIRNGLGTIHVAPGAVAAAARAEADELAADGCPVTVTELPTTTAASWADLPPVDVVLVAGGDRAAADTYALLDGGIPAGVRLLPAWVFGDRAVVGPVMGEDRTGCWCCAALRLTAVDPGSAARLWSGLAIPGTGFAPRPLGRPLAAMIGNLLGYEVFRLMTGVLPAETAGTVLVQNIDTLDVLSEPLLAHPACPFCQRSGGSAGSVNAADLAAAVSELDAPAPAVETAESSGSPDPSAEADAIVADLREWSRLLQPHVGVFTDWADEDWNQTPIKIGSVSYPVLSGPARTVHAFDVHHVAGARRRALFAGAASYAGQLTRPAPAGDRLPRIDPARILTATGGAGGSHGGWVTAVSLLTGAASAVPAAAVEPFGQANRPGGFEPTIAGSGAGPTLTAAVRQALGSALAYAALGRAVAGGRVDRVPLDSITDDRERTFLVKSAANLGIDVELLDLSALSPLPVLLAWCQDPDGGVRWEVAADLSGGRAATSVLCDLIGRVQLIRQAGAASDHPDPVLTDFDPRSLVVASDAPLRSADEHTWSGVLAALRAAGPHPYAVRVGGPDLRAAGVEAVRVVLATMDGAQEAGR